MTTRNENDLTVAQVAEEMSCSIRKVWGMVLAGELVSYKVGSARRIRREALDQYKTDHIATPHNQQAAC